MMKRWNQILNGLWRKHSIKSKITIALTGIFLLWIALYLTILKYPLMKGMLTVKIDLLIMGILFLCLSIVVVMTVVILFITGVLAIRKAAILKVWLMKLRRMTTLLLLILTMVLIYGKITELNSYTPPILDKGDKILEGSISSLEKIKLGYSSQWITIRGEDASNPVLLFLAGGPGGTQLAATRTHLSELEKHFIVVNWDQPGSGKSFSAVPQDELSLDKYISDASELTEYLCERFSKDKIYVIGESWGSALGIFLVDRNPERYHAFIGTGQMVSFLDTEMKCYKTAIQIAMDRGDWDKLNELKLQGSPPYYGEDMIWKTSAYLMYLSNYMANNPDIHGQGYTTFSDILGPEYSFIDKANYFRGILTTFNTVYQQLYSIDLRKEVVKLNVPAYFLIGKHDINAPVELTEEYYEMLDDPQKGIIWFEHSGHSPWIDESDRFVKEVLNIKESIE